MLRHEPWIDGDAASQQANEDLRSFASLEYGWGRFGRGLPARQDALYYALSLMKQSFSAFACGPSKINLYGYWSCYMTRHGTPVLQFRGKSNRMLTLRIPCRGVIEFNQNSNSRPGDKCYGAGENEGVIRDSTTVVAEVNSLFDWLRWINQTPRKYCKNKDYKHYGPRLKKEFKERNQ